MVEGLERPRGGAWNNHPINLRAANRNHNNPANRNNNLGLRLATHPACPARCRTEQRLLASAGRIRRYRKVPAPVPVGLRFGQRTARRARASRVLLEHQGAAI